MSSYKQKDSLNRESDHTKNYFYTTKRSVISPLFILLILFFFINFTMFITLLSFGNIISYIFYLSIILLLHFSQDFLVYRYHILLILQFHKQLVVELVQLRLVGNMDLFLVLLFVVFDYPMIHY